MSDKASTSAQASKAPQNSINDTIQRFTDIGLDITPAGIWEYNEEQNKKIPIDAKRKDYLSWHNFKNDNMGRLFITPETELLIVDIDLEPIKALKDDTIIKDFDITEHDYDVLYIPSLDLTLPKTFTTQTSQPGKYHIYYKVSQDIADTLPNRLVKSNGDDDNKTSVDFFTYGVIFDPHYYSPYHYIVSEELITVPDSVVDKIHSIMPDNCPTTADKNIVAVSNIPRYNMVQGFLNSKEYPTLNGYQIFEHTQPIKEDSPGFTSVKSWNAFFRNVFPEEFIQKGAKKITFDSFDISYDLINKIAVKLTATKELGTDEHIRPAIERILEGFGINPYSTKSLHILDKQIFATLPTHPPEMPYTLEDDALTIMEHIDNQPNTPHPIFRVIIDGQVKFIEIDRHTLEPIAHNNHYFINLVSAKALHPERAIYNEAGQAVGWDDNLPIVYVTDSPYEPQVFVDTKHNRNMLNTYIRTRYLKEAYPSPDISTNNLILRLIKSSIHPDYQELIMRYQAEVIFGVQAPTMVLWFASLKSDKGGTGKSIITVDIFSKVLGSAGTVISEEDMSGNWGDPLLASRVISLEDLPNLGTRQFDKLYAAIKQATSSSIKRLNMKGLSFRSERLNVAITGSSNERLTLHASDRRFLCIEPAHLRGHTEPLTDEEAIELERFRRATSDEYFPDLQEYVNYLNYLYQQPMSDKMYRWLNIEAPETPYRTLWVTSGQTNTANIIILLNTPLAFHDTVREDALSRPDLIELYQLIVDTFNPQTHKVALPWNWFKTILPYIQSEDYAHKEYTKSQVSKMLSVDFVVNVGAAYTDGWARKWKQAGYVYKSSPDEIEEWKALIAQMKEADDD